MKLLDITCPHCGSGMKVTDNAKAVHCEYCNHDLIIDDEVIHTAHHIEDAEQLGYDLEAGRRRYLREEESKVGYAHIAVLLFLWIKRMPQKFAMNAIKNLMLKRQTSLKEQICYRNIKKKKMR